MGEPAYNLPEEDRPDIRPDLPGLRALEGGGQGDGIPRGNLASVDKASDDSSGNQASSGSDKLAGLEAAAALAGAASQLGKGFTSGGGLSKAAALKNLFWSNKNKKKTIGGGVAGSLIAIILTISGISSGPLEAIHLAQILMKNFSHSENTSSIRVSRLFRYARTNDIGETRVGKLGSLTFAKTIEQMKDVGIEFRRNPLTGKPESITYDTSKMSEKFPELKNMSPAETHAFLVEKTGLQPGQIRLISGDKGKYGVSTRDFNIKAMRSLTKNSLGLIEDGKIVSAIKGRALAKFFNIPSLFHPIKRAVAGKENSLATDALSRQAEADRLKPKQAVPSEEAVAAKAKVKETFKSTQGKIGGVLLIAGAMCLVRNIADDVVTVNRAAIVIPAVVETTDKIAIGAQVQSGQDISTGQLGSAVKAQTTVDGHSIWEAQALSATATPNSAAGTDITPDYKQAFSKDTTAQNIKDTIGGGTLGDAACSPVGVTIQLVGGAALIALGPFSGGTSWTALLAAKTAVTLVATAGVFYMLEHTLTNLFSTDAITPLVLSGPVGGNLLAYAAREGANIDARASGGVALPGTDTQVGDSVALAQDTKEFQSRNFFARMFDVHDYRSLVSRAIDSPSSPGGLRGIQTMAIGLLRANTWTSTIASVFTPRAHAASPPYDWGFPQYGIPNSVANDPQYEDPYDNANKVAAILDADTSYADRAKKCFGVDISKASGVWNVVASTDVNPVGADYLAPGSNCNDTTDTWKRIMLFIFDTRTMAAVACFEGGTTTDQQACNDAAGGGDQPAADPTTPAGPIDAATLYQDSTSIACASGTKDLGMADGYHSGNKVPIRICGVPSITSTGEESNGGYGVAGANGAAVVNSRVSANFLAMGVDAKAAGITLTANSTFRTMAHQQALCPCDGVSVATPGTSNHQMGIAIDFSIAQIKGGITCTDRATAPADSMWVWLNKHAAKYGIKQYAHEAWHWDALNDSTRCGGDGT